MMPLSTLIRNKPYDRIVGAYLRSPIKNKKRNIAVMKVNGHDADKLKYCVEQVANLYWNYPNTKLN